MNSTSVDLIHLEDLAETGIPSENRLESAILQKKVDGVMFSTQDISAIRYDPPVSFPRYYKCRKVTRSSVKGLTSKLGKFEHYLEVFVLQVRNYNVNLVSGYNGKR